MIALSVPLAARQGPSMAVMAAPAASAGATMTAASQFVGVWDYNADESINIATGKPEQASTRLTRPTQSRSVDNSTSTMRNRDIDTLSSGALRPTPAMMREAQDLSRDLLEVPERLTIAVDPAAVTITDDLARERVYPTDGHKQRYRLGASQFDATVSWAGDQLKKDIDAGYGFKMTETYFLSPDGRRLFVVVRVGDVKAGTARTGFNRVYDRVEP
jgi:hypothetical protein